MIRRALLPIVVAIGSSLPLSQAVAQSSTGAQTAPVDTYPAVPTGPRPVGPASASISAVPSDAAEPAAVFGVSGALKAAVLRSSFPVDAPLLPSLGTGSEAPRWVPLHGTVRKGLPGLPVSHGAVVAPDNAGVWRLEPGDNSYAAAPASLTFITTVPFSEKRDEHLNGYHIGTYPTERSPGSELYAPPEAFIEVTAENQDLQVSAHFRLHQLLSKDQSDVWP